MFSWSDFIFKIKFDFIKRCVVNEAHLSYHFVTIVNSRKTKYLKHLRQLHTACS